MTPAHFENAVLMMARAGGDDGFLLTNLSREPEIRAVAADMAERGLLRIGAANGPSTTRIFLTSAGWDRSLTKGRGQ